MYEFWKDAVEEPLKVIDAFIMPLLNAALEKKAKENKATKSQEGDDEETLLEHLVNLTDGTFDVLLAVMISNDSVSSDPQIIKDETINILLAGRDTVSYPHPKFSELLSLS